MINPWRRRIELAEEAAQVARSAPGLAGADDEAIRRAVAAARERPVTNAVLDLARAEEAAEEARRRAEALDQAVADHAAAVKVEAARLKSVGKALTASKTQLSAAAKAADAALRTLFDAAVAHDSLVAQSAAELRAAGLPAHFSDGDTVHAFEDGGTAAEGLVLGGRSWTRLDALRVLDRARFGVLRAVGVDGMDVAYWQWGVREVEETGLFPPLPAAFTPEPDPLMAEARAAQQAFYAEQNRVLHAVSDSQRRDVEDQAKRDAFQADQATKALHRAAAAGANPFI